jgi:hypothetical protein
VARGGAALMCVPKHTLSADFTTRIAALLHVEHSHACHVRAPDARLVRRENSEKKGTFATPECKKALAKVCACAIFRADSHRAAADSA